MYVMADIVYVINIIDVGQFMVDRHRSVPLRIAAKLAG